LDEGLKSPRTAELEKKMSVQGDQPENDHRCRSTFYSIVANREHASLRTRLEQSSCPFLGELNSSGQGDPCGRWVRLWQLSIE
jgi:hypothetical protein